MKECSRIKKLIVLLQYNELEKGEITHVKSHISKCKKCNDYYREITKLKSVMNKYKIEESETVIEILPDREKLKIMPEVILKQIKYVLAILLITIGMSVLIDKTRDTTQINKEMLLSKDFINIIQNIDFYQNEELFENLEMFKYMDEYYEEM